MNRYKNKVAIVTGASVGIGEAIAKDLVKCGVHVVGVARSLDKLEALAKSLDKQPGKFIARKVDMSNEQEILDCFRWTTKNVGPVHILINNAAILQNTRLVDGDSKIWREQVDVNILGYTIAAREAVQIMRANKIDGHIVNLNSIAGHKPVYIPGMSLYSPTKFAITSYSELLRLELVSLGCKIKVTSISPGVVDTQIFDAAAAGMKEMVKVTPKLTSEHVANAVNYILSTPPEVQISELILQHISEPY